MSKPFDPDELRVRLHTAERILSIESRDVTIFSLAKLAESRDEETGAHVERMREYCRVIAEHLAQQEKFCDAIDGVFVQLIYASSPLHDVGKIGIPDRILLKPGPLTAAEVEIMKQHTVAGSMTLDFAIQTQPEARFLSMARDIARSHHERFDGGGYPDGLMGREIPLCARIVGLADVYDAPSPPNGFTSRPIAMTPPAKSSSPGRALSSIPTSSRRSSPTKIVFWRFTSDSPSARRGSRGR